ncbi:TIR-like protein FxsC [Streptomyces sp. BE20]|uniref:TIR-like protein FxsC n=1 Tax=Streptomyces sp. BE20 TaxID=3002525 RepID=UPI002E75BD71|nr:TIR-like protein FxsC [Streptomyces sp. BE20]MEE1827072.1 TIR-like protein FxsC [Streptomyces sp. BE20]
MWPYFFFSYARRDHLVGGAFVDQFFADLRDELARIAPEAGPAELAYRDTERLRVGDDWEQQLSRVIGASRTMVALYSPAYFASVYCGKEWTAFDRRMRRHRELTGETVAALIPVLWEPPPEDLPPEVRRIQYLQYDFGAAYAAGGLRHLLRSDPHGTEYRQVVRTVAERVREGVARPVVELRDLDLARVEGCFPAPDAPAGPVRSGLVRIFVAAGRAEGRAAERAAPGIAAGADPAPGAESAHDLLCRGGWYGAHPRDWAPYHPPRLPSLVVQAQRVITRAGHSTSLDTVGPDLAATLDRARENNEVSLLLLDPWAVGREPYRQVLREFDGQNHPVTGVLLPDGADDPPDGPARAELWEGVREVFPRNWLHRSGPDPLFRVRVARETFERVLVEALTTAQNRLLDQIDHDPAAVRTQFGLGPAAAALPGLTIPAWPPVPASPAGSGGPASAPVPPRPAPRRSGSPAKETANDDH